MLCSKGPCTSVGHTLTIRDTYQLMQYPGHVAYSVEAVSRPSFRETTFSRTIQHCLAYHQWSAYRRLRNTALHYTSQQPRRQPSSMLRLLCGGNKNTFLPNVRICQQESGPNRFVIL
ncbi:hypothetical protein L798_03758 [Zootermopsis nevadensis]|uniref:Uncharacterized protein n=1 Tax=Zootermopsis nevadensis TaxID=136037 RepID=A0A067RM56_ZOONE|nr:hypothetical protein L798_03758 [Zootermopsis nevadensis]